MDGERGGCVDTKGVRDAVPPRRPYRAPEVRRLGSVRELTLTGGLTAVDNNVTHTRRRRGAP
jgi:hypothetical protein